MKRVCLWFVVILILLNAELILAQVSDNDNKSISSRELIIAWNDGISEQQKIEFLKELGSPLLREYKSINASLINVGDATSYSEAFKILSRSDLVRSFEKNKTVSIHSGNHKVSKSSFRVSNDAETKDKYFNINPLPRWRFINKIHESQEFGKQKRKVIVALFTTGINLPHSSLKGVLWENTIEKNGKAGIDDDGNGWVDDIKGLNLKNQPDSAIGVWSQTIAGAIAGVANYDFYRLADPNGKVKIMPVASYNYVKKYGEIVHEYDYYWITDTAKLLESFEYAKQMGARIVVLPGYVGESKLILQTATSFPGLIITSSQYYYLENKRPSLLAQSDLENVLRIGWQGTYVDNMQSSPANEELSAYGGTYLLGSNPWHNWNIISSAVAAGATANLWSCNPKLDCEQIKNIVKAGTSQNVSFIGSNETGGFLNAAKSMLGRSSGGGIYNGDWAKMSETGPGMRFNFGLTYDEKRNMTYLFGGWDREHGQVQKDFWQWNGKKWKMIDDGKGKKNYPKFVDRVFIYFDMKRDLLVLLDQNCNVWTWNRKVWLKREAPKSFRKNEFYLYHAVHDSKRDLVVFIGNMEKSADNGLKHFEYDWSSWIERGDLSNLSEVCYSVVYDSVTEKITMLGKTSAKPFTDGLFEYDGNKWTKVSTEIVPGIGGRLVYNNENQLLRLGSSTNGYVGSSRDIWKKEGNRWKSLGFDLPLTSFQTIRGTGNKIFCYGYFYNGDKPLTYSYSGSIKPTWIDNMPLSQSDYDGDGKADIALWHPASGEFELENGVVAKIGKWGDTPVSGDYNGDGKVEHVVVQRTKGKSKWIFEDKVIRYGQFDDIPVPLDYDNDGKTDMAVFRKDTATWYFKGKKEVTFGNPADLPVPADYNGDGRPELATYTPLTSTWHIQGMGDFQFGKPGDSPVPADYDGDGRKDIATWNPRKRLWTVMEWGSGKNLIKERFGKKWDIPVPGDYNGDGKAQLATYTPMKALWNIKGQSSVKFGSPGDVPLVRGN